MHSNLFFALCRMMAFDYPSYGKSEYLSLRNKKKTISSAREWFEMNNNRPRKLFQSNQNSKQKKLLAPNAMPCGYTVSIVMGVTHTPND
jgi:hypothetical protein